ncbi:MAG: DUF2156 domain-containing protein [Eubacterium sp.]|nr:DUF2156 domain-containing protein [Eubacterium sp.]
MLEFKEIELSDKEWIQPLLELSDYQGCEYNFTNNYVWKDIYDVTVSRWQDFYICKYGDSFAFPAGRGDVRGLLAELKSYCDAQGYPLKFASMDKSVKLMLERDFPGEFEFSTSEGAYDYIYTAESLRTLKGKKLHSKRNYINRFKELPYTFERITPENIDECRKMSTEWCVRNNCENNSEKSDEMCAVGMGLQHFFELGLEGGLIRVDGAVQAFSYGERQNSNTFVTHVEKAFTDYDGAYPMINYLIANELCGGYEYINREEDMGEENLRKAKRSYHPAYMLEKYRAVYVGNGFDERK